ncbi:hypothetical protein [Mucilaginibacter rubeus]|uniref:Uncharacterized protein n=1 Tax=Mucilaginibacter rubeus TaxID=2027860 RepID=A0A5C1I9Q0_9SPHI|nr:hypothetical protein [Mucilaginibacter rubeus]QEM13481.1 hypothetical protein DEO27_026875 [Mucilaginibacter rubeus]
MKTEKEIVYPAGVSAEKVAQWKAENKNGIARIETKYEGKEYSAYIRRPTREDMRELSAKGGTVDPVTYTEIVLGQLWLGGDEEIRDVDAVFFGVMEVVQGVLDVQKAQLKKL